MVKCLFLIISLCLNTVLADEILKEDSFETISSYPISSSSSFNHSFADIVEPLVPAVVSIYTIEYAKKNKEEVNKEPVQSKSALDRVNEFLEQFKIPLNLEEMYINPKALPLGSGFIVDSNGLIVTNHHVIEDVDKIYVKLIDNTEFLASLIGSDKKTDLALLKIESESALPFVNFGNSAASRVGDWIIAIGNPFGSLGGTVTTGIISSKGRDIDTDTHNMIDNFIQTDAAINNGNSGGPMFNLNREVIGVNTAIFSPMGTNIGIGFAIPSNTAKPIIDRLRKDGKVHRGRLGVIIQELTEELSEGLDLKDTKGVLVVKVEENSPGDKAGIKSGDVILEFAGQSVKNKRKLQVIVAETPIDQEIRIIVIREGKKQELIGKLIEDNEDKIGIEKQKDEKEHDKLDSLVINNITFSNFTEELRQKFSIAQNIIGIIITDINEDQTDLKVGDVVIEVNHHNISNIDELNKFYNNAKEAQKQNIILLVERGDTRIFIPLSVI